MNKLSIARSILKSEFEKEFFHAGKSSKYKGTYDKKQLEMGKKVEKEHTTSPKIAEKISKDHLAESYPLPYYDYLEEMEDKIKSKLKKIGKIK